MIKDAQVRQLHHFLGERHPKKPIPPDPSGRASRDDPRFQPIISAVDRLVPGRVEKKTKEAEDLFLKERELWNEKVRPYNEDGLESNEMKMDWSPRSRTSNPRSRSPVEVRRSLDYEECFAMGERREVSSEGRGAVERP
jgi:hypothetical protein